MRNRNDLLSAGRSTRSAFTLLEILIVLALVGLLAGVLISNVDKVFGESQVDIAKHQVNQAFRVPLTSYRMHLGSYPSTEEGLEALVRAPEGRGDRWRGPYIDRDELLRDPWGNQYQYRYPGQHNEGNYDLWSFGPDGVDSDRNIGNW
jgi:general secretion pathway protein G